MATVLIVDDSPTIRLMIRAVLESDPELRVIGEASDGLQAIELCRTMNPDIVTMDIRMPHLNGFEATQRIMSSWPRPVLVLTSSLSDTELGISFKAVEAGALMVLGKPRGLPDVDPYARSLIEQVKAMASVKVIRRSTRSAVKPRPQHSDSHQIVVESGLAKRVHRTVSVLGIGASTGGPPALQTVLGAGLCGVPVVIVQHISPGFVPSLAHWLDQTTPWRVKVAEEGEWLRADTAYLAPDYAHLGVSAGGRVALRKAPPVDGHCPSATWLFKSLAEGYGAAAAGIILTGMGRDGTDGLKALHDTGGHTLAQDEATCVIYSMPKTAIEAGTIDEILPLASIGSRMAEIATQSHARSSLGDRAREDR